MTIEDRYNWEQFDLKELKKKKHPFGYFAFAINYNNALPYPWTKKLHSSIILDCDGSPVPRTVSKEVANIFAQNCPGAEWVGYDWTCRYGWGHHESPGIILDFRTWLMIAMGCCPEEQWEAF